MYNRELTVCYFSQTLFQTKYLYTLSRTKNVANEALISPAITQLRHREIKKVRIMKINTCSLQILEHCGCCQSEGTLVTLSKLTSHTLKIRQNIADMVIMLRGIRLKHIN
jgi:hypothetical protein